MTDGDGEGCQPNGNRRPRGGRRRILAKLQHAVFDGDAVVNRKQKIEPIGKEQVAVGGGRHLPSKIFEGAILLVGRWFERLGPIVVQPVGLIDHPFLHKFGDVIQRYAATMSGVSWMLLHPFGIFVLCATPPDEAGGYDESNGDQDDRDQRLAQ